MKQNVKSVVIVGVGGQGTLLASRVLGAAMLNQDYDVKMSEVHGLSQRGGNRLLRVQFCGFRHEKIPAFRRGSFAMFCFPRPLHIL